MIYFSEYEITIFSHGRSGGPQQRNQKKYENFHVAGVCVDQLAHKYIYYVYKSRRNHIASAVGKANPTPGTTTVLVTTNTVTAGLSIFG